MPPMTPSEKNIVKSLVAVAWADGKVEKPEEGVIEGLLSGFDATAEEEQEILAYAKQPRTLEEDVPFGSLDEEERELLLANAALMTHVDGHQSDTEKALLEKLIRLLGLKQDEAKRICDSAADGALTLGSRVLQSID
jgi:uncharacterized membrane protein YebE (DUF533 family)